MPLTAGTGRGKRVVKLTLQSGASYAVGAAATGKVKILGL